MLPAPVLRHVLLWALCMAAYSSLVVMNNSEVYTRWVHVPDGLEVAISLGFGLLLAFRVNRAFDRWWEGRILWGTLVNACRNFAVKCNALVVGHDESVDRLNRLLVAYPYALKWHLRGELDRERLTEIAGEEIDAAHVPSAIATRIYQIVDQWKHEKRIRYSEFRMLDQEGRILLEVCGGCERIRNTPIAPSYRVILSHAIVVYLLLLPWGIATEFGWFSVLIAFGTTYFVIGAEGIADHIEHPFVNDGEGLQLGEICLSIKNSVNEIFAAH